MPPPFKVSLILDQTSLFWQVNEGRFRSQCANSLEFNVRVNAPSTQVLVEEGCYIKVILCYSLRHHARVYDVIFRHVSFKKDLPTDRCDTV